MNTIHTERNDNYTIPTPHCPRCGRIMYMIGEATQDEEVVNRDYVCQEKHGWVVVFKMIEIPIPYKPSVKIRELVPTLVRERD